MPSEVHGKPKSKYFEGERFLVYLDQCVVSRFLDEQNDATWNEVAATLRAGVDKGKFLCPHSLEHLFETAAMSTESAIALDRLLRGLSQGWSIKLEPSLFAAQIAAVVRGKKLVVDDFLERNALGCLDDEAVLQTVRELKKSLDTFVGKQYAVVNVVHAAVRERRLGADSLRWLDEQIGQKHSKHLRDEVTRALRAGAVTITARDDMPSVPTWTSQVIWIAISHHGVIERELRHLLTLLDSQGAATIPLMHIRATLESFQHWKHQKIEPRDQYDITRMACVLPFADVVVTDGGVAQAIEETGLDRQYGVKVFSTKAARRTDLADTLKALLLA